MSQPIMRGQFAMDQMRTNLLANAANTIDMYLRGPINITLTEMDANRMVKDASTPVIMPAWLYVNSDDGTFTIAMPTALPPEVTNNVSTTGRYAIDYTVFDANGKAGDELWEGIQREAHAAPAATDYQKSKHEYKISEETQSKCYMFRTEIGQSDGTATFFPDIDNLPYPDGRQLDLLYIPPGTTRIGALVMKPYWTFSGFSPVAGEPDGH